MKEIVEKVPFQISIFINTLKNNTMNHAKNINEIAKKINNINSLM